MDARKIEVSLSHDKIGFISSTFQKELDYWKEAALERALDLNDANELKHSAPLSFFLACKAAKNVKKMDIDEIISYLKSQYSTNNRNQIAFVQNFPSVEEMPSFEGIQEELKIISKYMKDGKNMSLRNKALFGGWIAVARMVYKRDKLIEGKNLPQRFDYWMDKEFKIKKQTIYDYLNLYDLMSVAPKLLNCRVNMTYFVKNYEILMTYFKSRLIAWKHQHDCTYDDCNFYFFEMEYQPEPRSYCRTNFP